MIARQMKKTHFCKRKLGFATFGIIILYAEYFLTDISHLFITADEHGD